MRTPILPNRDPSGIEDECRSECLSAMRLPDPLTRVLKQPAGSTNYPLLWRRVEVQLDQSSLPAGLGKRTGFGWWQVVAASALGGVILLLLVLTHGGPSMGVVENVINEPQQESAAVEQSLAADVQADVTWSSVGDTGLRLRGGAAFSGIEARSVPKAVTFEDGSSLRLAQHSVVDALVMSARDVVLRLSMGKLVLNVMPDGVRRWTVQAGAVSVEVVGTRFIVERTAERVTVTVSHGTVLVRSEDLPERVERVGAGESLSVDIVSLSSHTDEQTKRTTKSDSQPPVGAVAALLERADRARLQGDWSVARHSLERVVNEFTDDPRAPLAAYQLATVRQSQGAAPEQVAAAFAYALRQNLGTSLRQDCYWRLLQAQIASGQRAASKETARVALEDFPDGRYSRRMREFLDGALAE